MCIPASKHAVTKEVNYQFARRISHVATTRGWLRRYSTRKSNSRRSCPMYLVCQSSRNKSVAATYDGRSNRKDQRKMAKREVGKRDFLFVMWDGAGGTIVEARIIKKLLRRGHAVTVLGPAALEDGLRSLGCDYVLDQAMAPYSSVRDYPPDELVWLRDHLWLGPAPPPAHAGVPTVAGAQAAAIG